MNQVLSTEICSKFVVGKAAEAPNLIYPKWGAGAAFTRPSTPGAEREVRGA